MFPLQELAIFLQDRSEPMRKGAARGLGLIRDHRVRSILLNALSREKSMDVRLEIDRAVGIAARWEKEEERRRQQQFMGMEPSSVSPQKLDQLDADASKKKGRRK